MFSSDFRESEFLVGVIMSHLDLQRRLSYAAKLTLSRELLASLALLEVCLYEAKLLQHLFFTVTRHVGTEKVKCASTKNKALMYKPRPLGHYAMHRLPPIVSGPIYPFIQGGFQVPT